MVNINGFGISYVNSMIKSVSNGKNTSTTSGSDPLSQKTNIYPIIAPNPNTFPNPFGLDRKSPDGKNPPVVYPILALKPDGDKKPPVVVKNTFYPIIAPKPDTLTDGDKNPRYPIIAPKPDPKPPVVVKNPWDPTRPIPILAPKPDPGKKLPTPFPIIAPKPNPDPKPPQPFPIVAPKPNPDPKPPVPFPIIAPKPNPNPRPPVPYPILAPKPGPLTDGGKKHPDPWNNSGRIPIIAPNPNKFPNPLGVDRKSTVV